MTAELVALIDANPDDVEAYRVYGDWLQKQGDPRGELIALYLLKERLTDRLKLEHLERKLTEYVATHQEALLGPLSHLPYTKWRYGFLHSVRVLAGVRDDARVLASLQTLLAHPSARFLHTLHVQLEEPNYRAQPIIDALLGMPPTIRQLALAFGFAKDTDLAPLWPRLARATSFSVRGNGHAYGSIDLPCVTELAMPGDSLGALAKARCPQLEHLAVHFQMQVGSYVDMRAVLERGDLPKLRKLTLAYAPFMTQLVANLSSTTIGEQLAELDLAYSDVTDEQAELWAAHAPSRLLKKLRLYDPPLTDAGLDALGAVAERVVLGEE